MFLYHVIRTPWLLLVLLQCSFPVMSIEKKPGNIEIPVPPDVSYREAPPGIYFVIGSFRIFGKAHKLALHHHQLTPRVVVGKVKGKQYFRVLVGPVKKHERALTRESLQKLRIKNAWVVKIGSRNTWVDVKVVDKIQMTIINKNMQSKAIIKKAPVDTFSMVKSNKSKPIIEKITPNLTSQKKSKYKSGVIFSDCKMCPELVVVPAGHFVLGDEYVMAGLRKKIKNVTIPRAFAIGRFEVTVSEWGACASAGGCSSYIAETKAWNLPKNPVTNISWNDAIEYVEWLSSKTGNRYRLPSEAEWEYAAKAGSKSKFWWGDNIGINQAACQECGSLYDGIKVAPVGTFSPNNFGLYDTAGNLWEWAQDCYELDAYKKHINYPRPVTGGTACSRVLRGGAWDVISAGIESSFRFASGSSNRSNVFGFRVVRDLN